MFLSITEINCGNSLLCLSDPPSTLMRFSILFFPPIKYINHYEKTEIKLKYFEISKGMGKYHVQIGQELDSGLGSKTVVKRPIFLYRISLCEDVSL